MSASPRGARPETNPADRREEALLSLVPRDPSSFLSHVLIRCGAAWRLPCSTIKNKKIQTNQEQHRFEKSAGIGGPRAAITDARPARRLGRCAWWRRDPSYLGGSWEAKTSEKVEPRFVKTRPTRVPASPSFHLVDNPGFNESGARRKWRGRSVTGVNAMNAIYRATVPLASVVLRPRLWHCGAAR